MRVRERAVRGLSVRAVIDPRLAARIVATRELRYSELALPDEDRPEHVRAASGLASDGERLFVIQDDASFVAVIEDERVRAIPLPPGPGGRRRFEKGLGNKLDKLDLEGCYVEDGALVAFGSGSIPGTRDRIVRVRDDRVELIDGRALYDAMRSVIGAINIEGAVRVGDDVWLFHRGNTGPSDRPAIVRVARDFAPVIRGVTWCDLGDVDGIPFGFTDATTAGGRVFVACAAEASPDAIEDGAVLGARIGVIDDDEIRCAALDRVVKIEGLAIADRTWITIDPDDVMIAAELCEIDLIGPW